MWFLYLAIFYERNNVNFFVIQFIEQRVTGSMQFTMCSVFFKTIVKYTRNILTLTWKNGRSLHGNCQRREKHRVFKMSLYLEIRIYTTKFSKNNHLNRSLLWSEVVSPLWQLLWQISHRICQTKVIKEPFECNLDVHI